jgi:hypothetical protein
MEKGATPSSVILPPPGAPAVATRASDCAVIRLPSPAALPFTFLVDSGTETSTGTTLPLGLGRTDGVWGFPKATYFVRSPGDTTAGLTTLNDDVGGGSIRGGRLGRDVVSVPLGGASAGWYCSVPVPGCHAGRAEPDRSGSPAPAAKFIQPRAAAGDGSRRGPVSGRRGSNAGACNCRNPDTVPARPGRR